ncbi:MAG TPA: ABC transporter ATP-binding protein [Dehalococcoidia bacterium]
MTELAASPGGRPLAAGRKLLVQLDGVSKIYGAGATELRALDRVSVDIYRGEFIVVLGPSGSGKTTLLNLLGGIDSPSEGRIVVGGSDIGRFSDGELTEYRRRSVGCIFQFFNLIPTLNAIENVELASDLLEAHREPREVLEEVGLGDRLNHFPSELSGGEQQRVAVARALVTDPPLVLCDEPTGNLDEETGKRVLGVMRELGRRRDKTFILVTHNSVIGEMADRVVRLRDGRIASVTVNETPAEPEEISW